uniref:Protein-serine O-palmitoleoyltransferase porcupine n=1 Tax=Clastoptera arizonana TaxID=38151 RepID=A0A1B6EDG5_9HEMI
MSEEYDYGEYYYTSEELPSHYYMFYYCIIPSFQQANGFVLPVIIACFLFRSITQTYYYAENIKHFISAATGLVVLFYVFESLSFHIFKLIIGLSILFYLFNILYRKTRGPIISIICFIILVLTELSSDNEQWPRIRGVEMLIVMKIISLAFDLDSGIVKEFPNMTSYFGYILCPGNVVFGPWVSFNVYRKIFVNPLWNSKWLQEIVISIIKTLIVFTISACCIDSIFFSMNNSQTKWVSMYQNALQYRTSHYFISFLSEATSLLAGFGSQSDGSWKISVAQLQYIELPRSLVQVVVSWNLSMHQWLKQYIFNSSRSLGGFLSVTLTYIVSSFLHGLNYRLAGVLMSLGFYTYIEYTLRAKLSSKFNACIAARPCPLHCNHRFTKTSLAVKIFNAVCSILTIFHLAYLGCLMNTNEIEATTFSLAFKKWVDLSFISHWIAFLTYVLYIISKLTM